MSNERFIDFIENLGDAYEMAEEMYGMIWWLARTAGNPVAAVEDARLHYEDGLALSPGRQAG